MASKAVVCVALFICMLLVTSSTAAKTAWPELVGKDAIYAREQILADNPKLEIHIVFYEACLVTADFDKNRVRIYTDCSNRVVRTPSIG
ncbi:subtilisin inhibitor [Selaginella moellendorffii]|nr:subtilisin inhibitor [Selaginella moellendorffii]|eukprot:XP_002965559.2 subtilisin inhibitor [Selaginella moellendorffii]